MGFIRVNQSDTGAHEFQLSSEQKAGILSYLGPDLAGFPHITLVKTPGGGMTASVSTGPTNVELVTAMAGMQQVMMGMQEELRLQRELLTKGAKQKAATAAQVVGKSVCASETVGPRYSLRKGLRTWELVFRGLQAPIDDGRGVQIAAYLFRNPPIERIHAINLERLVWALGYVDEQTVNRSKEEEADMAENLSIQSEAGGMARCQDDNKLLKQEVRELLEIIRDATLPKAERDEAQTRLDEISQSLSGRGDLADEAARAAERVRKAINRLHGQLAVAKNEKNEPHPVLREFAEHLRKYLMVPSARFTKSKSSRNKAGVAGTFTYEPPTGVVWEG